MGLKFVDLFCGIGTIRMGMEQAGHECVYSVEWDKHKRKIYSIIFGGEPEGADICAVGHDDIPKADVWTFGAPCQDFSIAGKRAGMEGERSSLILEVFRLLRETKEEDRPKYIIYENVKGMLSSGGGRDFLGILIEMASLGYDFIEYSLLNSKNFGVPQNRERVFTIGHLRGRCTGKVFPIKGTDENSDTKIKVVGNLGFISNEMRSRVYREDGLRPAISTMMGGYTQPMIIDTKNRHCRETPRAYNICPTLQSNDYKEPKKVLQNHRIRKLTPKECWRLQGIPNETTDKVIQSGISDSQMYRGAGDACTVNVIYEIANNL